MRSSSLVPCVLGLMLFAVPAHAVKPGTNPTDLSGVTQNWDKKLPNDARFTILADFNNQAVRDNETGLAWEPSPDTSPRTWYDAVRACWLREVGGRMGWHLPTIEELDFDRQSMRAKAACSASVSHWMDQYSKNCKTPSIGASMP
jgi:hypothetical protein